MIVPNADSPLARGAGADGLSRGGNGGPSCEVTVAVLGRMLGHYQILGQLGAGGMGEVYRALDATLKREVAIKVLPEELTGDAHRLARLEREAHTLAALNHPNVATIHGLERQDDVLFLVLELVEGDTLGERLRGGAIEVEECLGIARQIAEGLEAAHAKGIVHRDLKPANIKVTPDGRVKLLDFGLAKPLTDPGEPGVVTVSPTITVAATKAGVLLGTAPYMSPEQARGREVDEQTDVWAFGCVLYEMLAGRRPFEGDDVSEVLAAVIKSEPDWSRLPDLPPVVAAFLRRCLAKDPAERVRDIGDVRLALEGAFDVAQPAVEGVPQSLWSHAVAGAAAGVLLAGLVAWSLWPAVSPRVTRWEFESVGATRGTFTQRMAVAPDGGSVVYATPQGLYLRPIDQLDARPIPGIRGSNPFFSPDGRSVGYWSSGALKRTDTSGGATVVIAPVPRALKGAAWTDDGMIVYGQPDGVWRVPAIGGGTPEHILPLDDEDLFGPQLLPDGDSILISTTDTPDWSRAEVVVISMTTRQRTVIVSEGRSARYLSTGHLVYGVGDVLYAVAFDVQSLTTTGPAVPVVRGVQTRMAVNHYAVSPDGTLAYFVARTPDRIPVWVDRQGAETPIEMPAGTYVYARLAPDGRRIAFQEQYDGNDIWIWNADAGTRTRLTVGDADGGGWYPVWGADGHRVAYGASGVGLAWKSADNTGTPEVLVDDLIEPGWPSPYQFFEDGGLLFRGGPRIWIRRPGADPVSILDESTPERSVGLLNAHRSPNGRWLAYQSDESGAWEVYVRPFPVADSRVQVSNAAGVMPRWSSDAELLYVEPEGGGAMEAGAMISVSIDPESPVFAIESRTRLIDWPYEAPFVIRPWDLSADGRRFLSIKAGDDAPPRTVVVQNWFEELGRLAPTGR